MEIDPRYVDVAELRWQALTGKAALLARQDRIFIDVAGARQAQELCERA